MKHPLIQLIFAHIKEFFREPGAVFWSFGFPVLMALGLGVAFSGKKEMVHGVAVVPSYRKYDTIIRHTFFNGAEPIDTVIEKQFKSGYSTSRYVFHFNSWEESELLLKRGIITTIITEENNKITYHSDPLNPEAELISMQLKGFFESGSPDFYEGNVTPINTKGLRYIDFLVPGLLSMGIMMSVMWGVCYTLIEKRSKKLLRRMIATPMKKSHFLIAQWASRLVVALFETIVLLVFSELFFDISIQGNLLALIVLLLTGNFCFFGIAILLSSKTDNIQLGNGLISLITTPMIVLSGIFFSYQNFPAWVIKIIKLLPLTMFVDEVRSVINEGAGFIQIYDSIAVLAAFGLLTFVIGLKIYKWS